MRSKILANELVINKDKHHKAADYYYQAKFIDLNGTEYKMLLTTNDIDKAIERADKNQEDFVEAEPWWMFW